MSDPIRIEMLSAFLQQTLHSYFMFFLIFADRNDQWRKSSDQCVGQCLIFGKPMVQWFYPAFHRLRYCLFRFFFSFLLHSRNLSSKVPFVLNFPTFCGQTLITKENKMELVHFSNTLHPHSLNVDRFSRKKLQSLME